MQASNMRALGHEEHEDAPTNDILEIAMARFGYAVAGLGERDVMAVVELVERLTTEVKSG